MSVSFRPRVVLASLSGRSDADWARAGAEYAGGAVLGGIAIDQPTREAARELVTRDREEFLPSDPIAFVDEQLSVLDDVAIRPGVNVRAVQQEPLRRAARVCRDHDAFLELNAHCRQAELCGVGAGESLLADSDRLCEQVQTATREGTPVSVKVRAEVPGVDLPALATRVEAAGADAIHVDAMDSESVVADVAETTAMTVIANNEVRDRETVFEYLDYGADAVSVGRPSDNPAVLERVQSATESWVRERQRGGPGSEHTDSKPIQRRR